MNDYKQFVQVLFYLEFTLKYECVIKTIEIFNFLPLINNSVTIEFSFLLLIISAIISSKTINTFPFLFYLDHLNFP